MPHPLPTPAEPWNNPPEEVPHRQGFSGDMCASYLKAVELERPYLGLLPGLLPNRFPRCNDDNHDSGAWSPCAETTYKENV